MRRQCQGCVCLIRCLSESVPVSHLSLSLSTSLSLDLSLDLSLSRPLSTSLDLSLLTRPDSIRHIHPSSWGCNHQISKLCPQGNVRTSCHVRVWLSFALHTCTCSVIVLKPRRRDLPNTTLFPVCPRLEQAACRVHNKEEAAGVQLWDGVFNV